jgi:phosphopantothenoylcysteine synthetase/decarboxylase
VTRNLYVFACGAGPARDLPDLIRPAMAQGWDVFVGATPAGWDFIDTDQLRDLTGHAPRRDHSGRTSGWPQPDGVIIAPATINTVNKIAAGITDTWATNVIIECMGLAVPVVIAPNVNPALGRHPRYRQNVDELRSWDVSVLWEPEGYSPPKWMVPWEHMLRALQDKLDR